MAGEGLGEAGDEKGCSDGGTEVGGSFAFGPALENAGGVV